MKTIVNLNIPAAGDQTYYIRTYPKWLEFDSLHGGFMDGKTSLTVTFRKPDEEPVSGNYTGELIIVIEDTGYFRIGVICGYPETD